MDSVNDKSQPRSLEVSHCEPDFSLTRLILIDSYSRGKTVEIDLTGHTALTGENASGKTTLLRLIPLFFGEAPSRVIQSDENNQKFARYYLPHTSSYVVFEYERRGQRVLSVMHADGQSDGVNYRFINTPFRPDLFRDTSGLVQCQDLSRHLTKLGVDFTKPLSLTLYRQILQNEAGREYRQLATMYAFTGSGGRLKHIERIITSILLRATTFFDLKRMIVSSIQESTDAFSMRTNKRELTHWIGEYEAHNAVMEMAPIMDELELHDEQRRRAVDEFSILHSRFQLMSIKALRGKALNIAGKTLALPGGSHVDIDWRRIGGPIGHDSIMLVENYEVFDQIHRLNFDLPPYCTDPLVIYRGDKNESRQDNVKALLDAIELPVLAFVDIDPKGLHIAGCCPRLVGVVAPGFSDLNDTLASPSSARHDLYGKQLSGVENYLHSVGDDSPISALWKLMRQYRAGVVQERWIAAGFRLTLWVGRVPGR